MAARHQPRVRAKYGRVPPAYARLLSIDASLHAASTDTTPEAEFRASLAALNTGTRIDSAALPGIVARFGELLASRGKGAEAQAMLKRTLAWLPAGADSSAAIVTTLRRELRGVQGVPSAPPLGPSKS